MGVSTSESPQKPSWNVLYGIAAAEEGYFTTAQAAEAGYSRPLLAKYIANGRIERARHGIYRLQHFPPGEHEDLVVIWLWSGQQGIFSHETALSLHRLSDVMSAKIHLTVPKDWEHRRLRVPMGVMLHYADIAHEDKKWMGPVPVSSPKQTVLDCARAHLSSEFLEQAVQAGIQRGLFTKAIITEIGNLNGQ